MSRSESYSYSSLASTDAIRLLLLQPGPPGSDVHCSLIHTTLLECHNDIYQHYTALSYVWGDANKKRTVLVNEKPLEVTVNLAAALDDLRHEEIVLRLWADAICIDQANIPERNHQVGLMRNIYSLAQHTIIHLGGSNYEIDKVLVAAGEGALDSVLRNVAINEVLSRPWFTRVWVYQELVLSKDPWIQCGRTRVRWKSFHEGLGGQQSGNSDEFGASEHDNGIRMTTAFEDNERGVKRYEASTGEERIKLFSSMHAAFLDYAHKPPSLLSLLLSRRGSGVSDLRDLIYGHLAIAGLPSKSNSPPCPIVDYERSVVDVFTDATVHMVMVANTHEILLHNDAHHADRRLTGLPSWVPDWSLSSNDNLDPPPPNLGLRIVGWSSCDPLFRVEIPEPNLYALPCIKVETIESILPHDVNNLLQNLDTELPKGALTRLVYQLDDSLYVFLTARYREAHAQIRRVLGENFSAPLPDSDEVLLRDLEYRDMCDHIASFETKKLKYRQKSLQALLLDQALSPVSRKWTAGRKFARLSEGGLALVPPATRSGDKIYAFLQRQSFHPGEPRPPRVNLLVLRPYTVIPRANLSDLDRIIQSSPIDEKHFTMVGLAWIGDECTAMADALRLLTDPLDSFDSEAEWLRRVTHAIIH